MRSFGDLLAKIPIPGLKESNDRHIIATTISDTVHVPINAGQIVFKDRTIYIQAPPAVKAALNIKKQELQIQLSTHGIVLENIK